MYKLNQKGAAHILVLLAVFGVVAYVAVSSAAPFKDKLFTTLYPKRASFAASDPVSGPISGESVPPIVNITNPTNGSAVLKGKAVNITANASDNVGVARVEFYINGNLRCLDGAAPFSCSWSVPKQPKVKYTITAKAFDTSGNSASSSVIVTSR